MPGNSQPPVTGSDESIPRGLFQTARFALRQYGLLGMLGRYLLMKEDTKRFLGWGRSREERLFRRDLLRQLGIIHRKVPCAHSPYQFLLMAEYLLDLEVPGPIVECGCFKGGGTAKLSLLAARTGRSLYACDSFAGLPEPATDEERLLTAHGDGPNYELSAGEYKGTLEEVQDNVRRYGRIDVCEFVPGLFHESLSSLDIQPAFVFIDVDYASSARECLKHLWPRLMPGGYWFTHEAAFPQYVMTMLDADFWQATFGESPPVMMGAGSGLSVNAASLAYFQKRHCA